MQTSNLTTVLIFGTFDIFHKGHENFIKQARSYGDYLGSGDFVILSDAGAKNPVAKCAELWDSSLPPPPHLMRGMRGPFRMTKSDKITSPYLIAVIARDKTVLKIKGALPRNNEKSRLNNLRDSGLVDKTILGSLRDKYAAIRQYKPDIICLGYDQNRFVDGLCSSKIINLKSKIKIIRLKPYKPHIYKSSLL